MDKIDLPDPRNMVEQDVFAPLAQVSHGTEAGKLAEVADQVRLVEKSAGRGNRCPVRLRNVSYQLPRPLKPAHTAIELRRQADVRCEKLNEPSLAEANLPSEIANLQPVSSLRARLLERIKCKGNCTVSRPCLAQASDEHLFQHRKALRRCGRHAKPFTQLGGGWPPERFQIHMRVDELVCRYSEDRDRTARSEMHADDRRVLERVNQKALTIRPRDSRPPE